MPKKTASSLPQPPGELPLIASGASGGPSTGKGIDYQVDYATYRALELISQALVQPHKDWSLTVEPRVIGSGAVSRWDVSSSPPLVMAELKLKPSREDLIEWLGRIAASGDLDTATRFLLVYATGGSTLLSSIGQLRRISVESTGEAERFRVLYQREQVRDADEIINLLGAEAPSFLRRMELANLPESTLLENIGIRARTLSVGPETKLVAELRARLRRALTERSTWSIRELIAELKSAGVVFHVPQEVRLGDLPEASASTLTLLQRCPNGLPAAALAEAAGCSVGELASYLESLVESRAVVLNQGRWCLTALAERFVTADMADVLARGLSALVRYVSQNEDNQAGRGLILDVVG